MSSSRAGSARPRTAAGRPPTGAPAAATRTRQPQSSASSNTTGSAGSRKPMTAHGHAQVPADHAAGGDVAGRPKTAAGGRLATAGPGANRHHASRPPATASGAVQRPQTTMSVAAGQFFDWAERDNAAPVAGQQHGGNRPPSAAGRTLSRAATAHASAAGMRFEHPKPHTPASRAARPASRLQTQHRQQTSMDVAPRPVTNQGVAGVRPATTRGLQSRQVMDRSYFIAALRGKISDLNKEINRLTTDNVRAQADRQNMGVYEKKAEETAKELRELQGTLADYNTVIDKINTNSGSNELEQEIEQHKTNIETEETNVETLFSERMQKEATVRQLETDLENEKQQNDILINNLDPSVRQRFDQLKEQNEQLSEEMHLKQNEVEQLTQRKSDLEDELAVSQIKQEAMTLHEQIVELQANREAIRNDLNSQGTEQDRRERLLEKVRKDNEEMVAMERQMQEFKDKIEQCSEEMKELETEYEDTAGEKSQKYRELRAKEQQIDEFLTGYATKRAEEASHVKELNESIVLLLNEISRNFEKQDKAAGAATMDDDYTKDTTKSLTHLNTVEELQQAHVKLQEDLIDLQENKNKALSELENLQVKMTEISQDMNRFDDIEALKAMIAKKRQNLETEKATLENTGADTRQKANQLSVEVGKLRSALAENDAHAQLTSLEKKLQHLEQNNFSAKESLLARKAETDWKPIKEQCMKLVRAHNELLVKSALAHTRAGSGGIRGMV